MTFLFFLFCGMMFFSMLSWFLCPPFFRPRPLMWHRKPRPMHHMGHRHGRMGGRRF